DDSDEDGATGHMWYLVQSKYGTAFGGEDTLIREGRKVLETLEGQRERLSSLSERLLARLTQFRKQASERDRITLVFGTDDPLADKEKRALEDVRALGRARVGSLFDVEAVSIYQIYQRVLEGGEADHARLRVPIRARVVESGDELLVGSVSLMDLFEFLKDYRTRTGTLDQLYEKNVRQFLGGRRKVNKAMRETLETVPERFGLFNNGITIVVAEFQQKGGTVIELVEPSIVNGCQTTRTIWEVFHERLDAGGTGADAELDAWLERSSRGVVVAKIVKVGVAGESMLLDITKYTNSQNAVRDKDFIALDSDFRSWSAAMAERYDIYLEIQRGGWDSRRALQKQAPSTRQFEKSANAFDLLKVYGSGWFGEAGTAFGRNAAFALGGTVFKRIMEAQDGGSFGVEDLNAAFLLDRASQDYQFGRGAPKLTRRQTRFFFFMVAIELLKDVLARSELAMNHRHITTAVLSLFKEGNEEARGALLDHAVEVIDEYLSKGTEDSVFDEPSFAANFNNDLNGLLKSEGLGRDEKQFPHFRKLVASTKHFMGMRHGGQPPAREVIAKAVKASGQPKH
ncbi:MAG TPA: AIPR family protein, partial [Pirellulales bacterium]|nr:AIPR family protein [Pirellulales bacterium]